MALGFGFNKAKVLGSAEKYVQQGKLQNAIGEYEKVVKADPKDLPVLNTIGDLYARLGQADRATSYFKRVGDSYARDGFTVKAIAMYKKITKLAPQNAECVHRLAELYTQQGLFNDARQQYMLLADQSMRSNDLDGAARIFQKMLELDPENAAMQSRLADLYMRMGRKEEARDIFFRAAESLYQRAAFDAAEEAVGRILSMDPSNARALRLRAQIAVDSGDAAGAVSHLERIPNLDSLPDALHSMLKARLLLGQHDEAEAAARKLLNVHNDMTAISSLADGLIVSGAYEHALRIYEEFCDSLAMGSSGAAITDSLGAIVGKVKDNANALQLLLNVFQKAGDKTNVSEVMELLAHALVTSGDLPQARDLYRQLSELEPENTTHQQNYRQILAKLGEDAAVRPLTAEEGAQAFMVEEIEMAAAPVQQDYPPEVAEAIKAALTDSELFDSYNIPAKAIAPLEKLLPHAPRDARLNTRLAALYAAANRWSEAAKCCEILQAVHNQAGHADEARQYADMGAKYRQRAGVGEAAPAAVSEFAIETSAPASPVEVEAAPAMAAAPAAAQEIDLSSEWESAVVVEPPAPAPEPAAATAAAPAEFEVEVVRGEGPVVETSIQSAQPPPVEPPPRPPQVVPPPPPPMPAAQAAAAAAGDVLSDFVTDLEESLGTDFAIAGKPAAPASKAPPPKAPPPPAPAMAEPSLAAEDATSALSDIFEEFKEEAEGAKEPEDPETHYNLGVAFKEMGLLDEAIGELQKVCLAIDRGHAFRETSQAYIWLAHCFMEKGVPEAAVKWFDKALKLAADDEAKLALHYELASAYETSGNRPAALQHFMEVYGVNIDYRDVAARIKALRS